MDYYFTECLPDALSSLHRLHHVRRNKLRELLLLLLVTDVRYVYAYPVRLCLLCCYEGGGGGGQQEQQQRTNFVHLAMYRIFLPGNCWQGPRGRAGERKEQNSILPIELHRISFGRRNVKRKEEEEKYDDKVRHRLVEERRRKKKECFPVSRAGILFAQKDIIGVEKRTKRERERLH